MATPGHTIQIPRWIQLVGLPVLAVLAFLLVGTLGHVLFLFLTASVIAFMLNPLVRDLSRLKVPRTLSVIIVYAIFAATVVALLIAIGVVAFDQARNAAERIDDYVTDVDSATGQTAAELDIDGLQVWLDDHGLESIQVREQVNEWIDSLGTGEISGYVQDGIEFAQGAAISVLLLLFSAILIVVISIYMLLDMPRLERSIDRRFPPHGGPPLTNQIESALWGYVKGQAILSTVIGTSAGVGMWILGKTGLVEGADEYALLFGLWTAFIEVIPYIGPWLSAVPPVIYALFVDPVGVDLGRAALPLHLPGGGAHRGSERHGERAAPASAARHLRASGGRRAVRDRRRAGRTAHDGRAPGSVGLLPATCPARALGRGGARRPGGSAARTSPG